jgi:biotin carboxyl carrier protein
LSYIESCRAAVEVGCDAQEDLVAPMPCKVLSVQKVRGDKVEVGDIVIVVEGMKMQVSLKASRAGQF